jgi:hypothetical protein
MFTNGVNTGSYTGGSISSWASTAPALSGGISTGATVFGYR